MQRSRPKSDYAGQISRPTAGGRGGGNPLSRSAGKTAFRNKQLQNSFDLCATVQSVLRLAGQPLGEAARAVARTPGEIPSVLNMRAGLVETVRELRTADSKQVRPRLNRSKLHHHKKRVQANTVHTRFPNFSRRSFVPHSTSCRRRGRRRTRVAINR